VTRAGDAAGQDQARDHRAIQRAGERRLGRVEARRHRALRFRTRSAGTRRASGSGLERDRQLLSRSGHFLPSSHEREVQ
jgi:hypothetical protein